MLNRALGSLLHNGAQHRWVAARFDHGHDIDDAPLTPFDHALLGNALAQHEVTAQAEVHHLFPGRRHGGLRGCAPGHIHVIHQNVDVAHAVQCFIHQAANVGLLGDIGGHPAGIDASALQVSHGQFQVVGRAGGEHEARTRLTQCVRHLQAQAAGAVRHQGGFATEVKQSLNGAGHGQALQIRWTQWCILAAKRETAAGKPPHTRFPK